MAWYDTLSRYLDIIFGNYFIPPTNTLTLAGGLVWLGIYSLFFEKKT